MSWPFRVGHSYQAVLVQGNALIIVRGTGVQESQKPHERARHSSMFIGTDDSTSWFCVSLKSHFLVTTSKPIINAVRFSRIISENQAVHITCVKCTVTDTEVLRCHVLLSWVDRDSTTALSSHFGTFYSVCVEGVSQLLSGIQHRP